MTDPIASVLASARAATSRMQRELAAEDGLTVEQALEREAVRAARERRVDVLERSGLSLPPRDVRAIAVRALDQTEPLGLVQRWYDSPNARPILCLCGAVGVGKTVAAGWLVAHHGGGSVVHAPSLARRVLPTYHELKMGAVRVPMRSSLIVLDDLGTEPRADARWAEAFASLMENRLAQGRTLITANMRGPQFGERYGERILSRLNAHGHLVDLKSERSLRADGGGW